MAGLGRTGAEGGLHGSRGSVVFGFKGATASEAVRSLKVLISVAVIVDGRAVSQVLCAGAVSGTGGCMCPLVATGGETVVHTVSFIAAGLGTRAESLDVDGSLPAKVQVRIPDTDRAGQL